MRSKTRLLVYFSLFLVIPVLHTIQQPSGVNAQPANSISKALVERVASLEKKVDQLTSDFAVGTVVFLATDSAPNENWVRCDGLTKFPESAPAHLKGQLVPRLTGALIAVGDPSQSRVEGELKKREIKGSDFTLPETTQKRIAADKGNATKPHFKGGLVATFQANGDYLDVKHNTADWPCFGGRMYVEPAIYEYHPKGTTLNGAVEFMPPTHAFLQAFVRIR